MATTALHSSAAFNSVDDLRREIADGLDINEPDENRWTPLHRACMSKSYDAAKILIEAGAGIDPQDNWGNTPLNAAVFKDGVADLVRLLINHGADPTIENYSGHSPLSEVKRYKSADYLAIFTAAGYP